MPQWLKPSKSLIKETFFDGFLNTVMMNPSKCHFLYQKNETTCAIFPSFLTIFGHFEMLFLTGSCLGDTRPWLLTPPSALDDMHFCSGKALGAFQVVHFFATSTFNGGCARESSFQKGSSFLTSFLSQNDSQIKHMYWEISAHGYSMSSSIIF